MSLMKTIREKKIHTTLTSVGFLLFFIPFIFNLGVYGTFMMKVGAISAIIGTIMYFIK